MRRTKRMFCLLLLVLSSDESAQAFTPPARPLKRSLHMTSTKEEQEPGVYKPKNLGDVMKDVLRNLAQLSLEDYKWRSDLFKTMNADRLLEESMARMRGDNAGYVRPMDAAVKGPLGDAEESAVSWLSRVIEEEGRRAKRIYDADGSIVRPIDSAGGPLAEIEQWFVDWLGTIKKSEDLRKSLGVLRPKDLQETERGPLGNAEYKLYQALKELSNSEALRYRQSVERGSSVRPMDVPGPLGEVESAMLEIFRAEVQRSLEVRRVSEEAGEKKVIRPMNASLKGPLGEAEQEAIRAIQRLSDEERERLQGIFKKMEENRPMELNRNSLLGVLEAVVVGILRGPQMVISVFERVSELIQSEPLPLQKEVEEPVAKSKFKQPPVKTTTLVMPPDDDEDDWGVFQ